MMDDNGVHGLPSQSAASGAEGGSLLSMTAGQPGRHILAHLLILIARRQQIAPKREAAVQKLCAAISMLIRCAALISAGPNSSSRARGRWDDRSEIDSDPFGRP